MHQPVLAQWQVVRVVLDNTHARVQAWYRSLDEVDPGDVPTLYLAHEFLDALPVHQFERSSEHAGTPSNQYLRLQLPGRRRPAAEPSGRRSQPGTPPPAARLAIHVAA